MSNASNIVTGRIRRLAEPAAWIMALLAVWLLVPLDGSGITLCLFHYLGLSWCPGCGIGTSMALLMHGDVAASMQAHWFGIPALLIITLRTARTTLSAIRYGVAEPEIPCGSGLLTGQAGKRYGIRN